jgi:hypothetical protein
MKFRLGCGAEVRTFNRNCQGKILNSGLITGLRGYFGRREDPPTKFTLNIVTLNFADPEVERDYAFDNLTKALPLIRLSLFFAALLYASFGILDYHVLGEQLIQVWSIRFFIVCPIMLAVILASFFPFFRRVAQVLLSVSMLSAGIGVVIMTAIMEWPANSFYYAGLIRLPGGRDPHQPNPSIGAAEQQFLPDHGQRGGHLRELHPGALYPARLYLHPAPD